MEMELTLRSKIQNSVENESKPGGFENAVKDLKNIISKYINNGLI
jgi:hypothetical protein